MAIVQISRITHRKGLIENLPQLAGGEFGWAVDSRRLFIGNGTLAEGAPVVGNTEILTQYSDILGLASTYTYKGEDAGYVAQTGVTATGNVVRSLQQKIDEGSASVKDFGAVGDGVADDTAAINRALYQLFCREANEEVRRSLFFPAGIYNISGTIKVPPYAKLYGEGADSTIVRYTSSDGSTVDDYVVRTADSLQQIGANIGSNGATAPQNIEVSSLSFETTETTQDILLIEKLNQGYFDSVNFKGALVQADLSDALNDVKAITIVSSTALPTTQVTFDKSYIQGATYGFYTNYNTAGITVSNSTFDTLYRGVVLGAAPVNGGPEGVRILHNLFDNVSAQGIQIGAVGYNSSAFNFFKDVGNDFDGTGNPATTVISIGNSNNLSYGDLFERTDADDASFKRIELNDFQSVALGSASLTLGNYERTIGYVTTLNDNTSTAAAIFTLNRDRDAGYEINYNIKRGDDVRTGVIKGTLGYGSNSGTFDEEYSESAGTGVTFSVTESSGILSFKYTTTSTGDDATFTYSIAKFNR
jgi:hypothetical protein